MNKVRRVVNNTLISLFGQLVTWSSTLLLTIAYGRFLGDFKYGELYFAITFVSLVGFPLELGFNQQLTRDVAEDPEKAQTYLWNTLLIKLLMWIVVFGLLFYLAWALGYDADQRSLVEICGITLLSSSIVNTFTALHYALERTIFPAVGMMLQKGLNAVVGIIVLSRGASVQTMAFVMLGGSLIDATWVAIWFFRMVDARLLLEKAIIRKLFRGSIPFVVYGVLGVIYSKIDTVLLSQMTNAEVVGWYGAAYALYDTLFFLPNIIVNAVMYPVFTKLSANPESESELKLAIEKCMNFLLMCSLPIACLMIFAAPNIISFLYHRPEFANAVPALQFLAPCVILVYTNTLFFNLIVIRKGEKKIPILAGLALIFNVGSNLLLIPLYRHVGAAIDTTLTELLLLCLSIVFTPKSLLPKGSLKILGKVVLATILMAMAVFILRRFSIVLIGPVSLLVYAAVGTLLKTIPREDVQTLVRVFKSRGKGGSSEILENIVDENVFTQVTQMLPAISLTTTTRLPAVQPSRSQPTDAEPYDGVTLEDLSTLLLPAVRARRYRLAKVDPADDTTIHLTAVKTNRERRRAALDQEQTRPLEIIE